MDNIDFKIKILELEEMYLNEKKDRGVIIRKILTLLEEEWENETTKSENK